MKEEEYSIKEVVEELRNINKNLNYIGEEICRGSFSVSHNIKHDINNQKTLDEFSEDGK